MPRDLSSYLTLAGTPGASSVPGGSALPTLGDLANVGLGILEQYITSKLIPGDAGAPAANPLVDTSAQCPDGTFRVPGTNQCLDLIPGGATSGGGMVLNYGEAVMGRYGAGLVPAQTQQRRLRCPPGAVLGKDNLCYDRLRRGDRKWIPGRKPLLTGGDLNAISRSSRVAKRLKKKNRELQRLGLLPKPKTSSSRRASSPPRGQAITVVDTD